MKKHERSPDLPRGRARTYAHISFWFSAAVVGVAAILYARLIAAIQGLYFHLFALSPWLVAAGAPVFFFLATALVVWLAPEAKGSGIPQVLEAIEFAGHEGAGAGEVWKSRLVSLRTAVVKVLSSALGIVGGASIGREGPTVQIAASAFAWTGNWVRKRVPAVDFETYLVAGGAAGVAAAFNTPLAGITFALEEIAEGTFGPFRQTIMPAVIVAGITAQALEGNYLYFGRPTIVRPDLWVVPEALLIGLAGGLLGGLFAKLLAEPKLSRLPGHWAYRALVCGAVCGALVFVTDGHTAGSGYEVTKASLESAHDSGLSLLFPILKMVATVLSYLSGMAGGIFSPCLAIGGGVGSTIAHLCHLSNPKSCALMGMVAFFSAVVQAPLTAVIIVMEMTDQHALIIPFLIAAYLAQAVGKMILPVPLYRYLATRRETA